MASIRNRSPWRVSIKGAPERDTTFPSKKQATAHARVLEAQGLAGLRIAQDRTGVWEVRIRRTGIPTLAKCFETKRAADDWAAAREGEISKREFIDYREADRVTAGDLFKRFSEERTTAGPAGGPERNRLAVFQTLPLAAIKMSALRPSDIAAFRDAETRRGLKGPSVRKGLELMCRVFNTASREWNIYLPMNPASATVVKRPKAREEDARNRTLVPTHMVSSAAEVGRRLARVSGKARLMRYEAKLALLHRQGVRLCFHPEVAELMDKPMSEFCALARAARYPHWFVPVETGSDPAPLVVPGRKARNRGAACRIWAILSFGVETAMRRGEMSKLRWAHVHLKEGYLNLPASITKNRCSRIVPLSLRARRILLTQPRTGELVFDTTVESIEAAHQHVMARIGAHDLRFHDLRHESTTRLVQETNLSPLQVGQITGHKDPRMLARYYNPSPEQIVQIVQIYRTSRR